MTAPSADVWRGRVLGYLDEHAGEIVADLSDLVRQPSISGSDEENSVQSVLAGRLREFDLDVDHWAIPLTETLTAADFPGVEVERAEAGDWSRARPDAATGRR